MFVHLNSPSLIKAEKYKTTGDRVGKYSFVISHSIYDPEGNYVGSYVIKGLDPGEPISNEPHPSSFIVATDDRSSFVQAGFATIKDCEAFLELLKKGELPDVFSGSEDSSGDSSQEDQTDASRSQVSE